MSSVRNVTTSNRMPVDLADILGSHGVAEILLILWQGYDFLCSRKIVNDTMAEDQITQEWFMCINRLWHSKNRASCIKVDLTPFPQYEDLTLAKPRGKPPTIDFCFRAWDEEQGYFGAECKNLFGDESSHIKRYIETGIDNYTTGRYGSKSSQSSMVGYVLSGEIAEVVDALSEEMSTRKPHTNIVRCIGIARPQYKSVHTRTLDGKLITVYHLFFDFVA